MHVFGSQSQINVPKVMTFLDCGRSAIATTDWDGVPSGNGPQILRPSQTIHARAVEAARAGHSVTRTASVYPCCSKKHTELSRENKTPSLSRLYFQLALPTSDVSYVCLQSRS